jgi:hypothetical protein
MIARHILLSALKRIQEAKVNPAIQLILEFSALQSQLNFFYNQIQQNSNIKLKQRCRELQEIKPSYY